MIGETMAGTMFAGIFILTLVTLIQVFGGNHGR